MVDASEGDSGPTPLPSIRQFPLASVVTGAIPANCTVAPGTAAPVTASVTRPEIDQLLEGAGEGAIGLGAGGDDDPPHPNVAATSSGNRQRVRMSGSPTSCWGSAILAELARVAKSATYRERGPAKKPRPVMCLAVNSEYGRLHCFLSGRSRIAVSDSLASGADP